MNAMHKQIELQQGLLVIDAIVFLLASPNSFGNSFEVFIGLLAFGVTLISFIKSLGIKHKLQMFVLGAITIAYNPALLFLTELRTLQVLDILLAFILFLISLYSNKYLNE